MQCRLGRLELFLSIQIQEGIEMCLGDLLRLLHTKIIRAFGGVLEVLSKSARYTYQ